MKSFRWTVSGILGVCALTSAIQAQGTRLILATDGKPAAVIVVPADAAPKSDSLSAAKILSDHLRQMSGARFDVKRDNELRPPTAQDGKPAADAAQTLVFVGESELTKKLGVTTEGVGSGGYCMKTVGNNLVLAGPSNTPDRFGTTHAVVAFLEELGCRFLWPGETGKVVPKMTTIAIGPIDKQYTPLVGQRNIRYQPSGPRFFDKGLTALGYTMADWQTRHAEALKTESSGSWMEWHGLNGHVLGILGGHNGCGLGQSAAQALKDHPEWGALQADGSRDQSKAGERFRLCVSNPKLAEFVADLIRQKMKEAPGTVSYSLSPQDGGASSFCMCEECKKLDPPDAPKIKIGIVDHVGSSKRTEIEYPALSDRYVHYWNTVAGLVAKDYPNLLLVVDAYSVYATPPVREKLHANLVVRYVPSDPNGWEGWKAAGARKIFWRPNNLHSGYRLATINYAADARQIGDTMSLLARSGMIAVDIQGIYLNWATQGLNYYVAARAMWNPNLTYDAIVDDYCRTGFGPAAEFIRRYFAKAEEIGHKQEDPANFGTGQWFVKATPAAMEEMKALLDQADRAAADDEAVRKRIAFLRVGFDYSALTARAGQMCLAVERKQTIDVAEAHRVLDQRWQLMHQMYERELFAVNVGLVAGYDDTNWRDVGWRIPAPAAAAAPAASIGDKGKAAGAAKGGKTKAPEGDAWQYEDQSQTGKKKTVEKQ